MLSHDFGGRRVTRIGMLALVLTGALALAGCGRRGALEIPTADGATSRPAAQASNYSLDGGKSEDAVAVKKPDEPFVLDPIL
jgi:predicted small lipoprotein YifL